MSNNWRKKLSWRNVFDPNQIEDLSQYTTALVKVLREKGIQDKPHATVEQIVDKYIDDTDNALSENGINLDELLSIVKAGVASMFNADVESLTERFEEGWYDDPDDFPNDTVHIQPVDDDDFTDDDDFEEGDDFTDD